MPAATPRPGASHAPLPFASARHSSTRPSHPPVQLTIDWIQLAELVGAVQGFLLAAVLIAHRTNGTANRLLAALMVACTVSLLSDVYYSAGLVRSWPHFF